MSSPLSAGGGGGKGVKNFSMLAKRRGLAIFEFLRGDWIFSEGGGGEAEDFMEVILNF